jgi:hypothetical protein
LSALFSSSSGEKAYVSPGCTTDRKIFQIAGQSLAMADRIFRSGREISLDSRLLVSIRGSDGIGAPTATAIFRGLIRRPYLSFQSTRKIRAVTGQSPLPYSVLRIPCSPILGNS